jgi:DNA-directed RNA polymerase I and III subunit RPAC2
VDDYARVSYQPPKLTLPLSSPRTVLCGYSVPHPSEFLISLRIQTDGSAAAKDVLHDALDNLSLVAKDLKEKFIESFSKETI